MAQTGRSHRDLVGSIGSIGSIHAFSPVREVNISARSKEKSPLLDLRALQQHKKKITVQPQLGA